MALKKPLVLTNGKTRQIDDLDSVPVTSGGTGVNTLPAGQYLKGNGTGNVLSSATIPNTDITGLGTMSTQNASSVAITGGTITGLSAPVNPSDAVTKAYADALKSGLDIKDSVRVASTANINLATGTLLTIDGVLLKDGMVTAPGGVSNDIICASNYVKTDVVQEFTLDAGVTVDGVLCKDGNVTGEILCANNKVKTNIIEEKTGGAGITFAHNAFLSAGFTVNGNMTLGDAGADTVVVNAG